MGEYGAKASPVFFDRGSSDSIDWLSGLVLTLIRDLDLATG